MTIQTLAQYLEGYPDQYFSLSFPPQRICLTDLESSLYPPVHFSSSIRDYAVFYFHRLEQLLLIALRNEMRTMLDNNSLTDETAHYYLEFLNVISAKSIEQIYPLLERIAQAKESQEGAEKFHLIKGFAAQIQRIWNPEKLVQVLTLHEEITERSAQEMLLVLQTHFQSCSRFLPSSYLESDISLYDNIHQYAEEHGLGDVVTWLSQVKRALPGGELQRAITETQKDASRLQSQHHQIAQQVNDLVAAKKVCEKLVTSPASDLQDTLLFSFIKGALEELKQFIIENCRHLDDIACERAFTGFADENNLLSGAQLLAVLKLRLALLERLSQGYATSDDAAWTQSMIEVADELKLQRLPLEEKATTLYRQIEELSRTAQAMDVSALRSELVDIQSNLDEITAKEQRFRRGVDTVHSVAGEDTERRVMVLSQISLVEDMVKRLSHYNELFNLSRFIPDITENGDQEVRCHSLADFTRAIAQHQANLERFSHELSTAESRVQEAEQARAQYLDSLRAPNNETYTKAMGVVEGLLSAVNIAIAEDSASLPEYLHILKEEIEDQQRELQRANQKAAQLQAEQARLQQQLDVLRLAEEQVRVREESITQAEQLIRRINDYPWCLSGIAENAESADQDAALLEQHQRKFNVLYNRHIRATDESPSRGATLAVEPNEQAIVNTLLMSDQKFDDSFGGVRLETVDFTQLPTVRLVIGEESLEFVCYDFQTILLVALRNEMRALQDSAKENREILCAYQHLLHNLKDTTWAFVSRISNMLANISRDSQLASIRTIVDKIQRFWNPECLMRAYDMHQASDMVQQVQLEQVKGYRQFVYKVLEIFLDRERLINYRDESFLQNLTNYAERTQTLGLTYASAFLTKLLSLLNSLKAIEARYAQACQERTRIKQQLKKARQEKTALELQYVESLCDAGVILSEDVISKPKQLLEASIKNICEHIDANINPRPVFDTFDCWWLTLEGEYRGDYSESLRQRLVDFVVSLVRNLCVIPPESIENIKRVSDLLGQLERYKDFRDTYDALSPYRMQTLDEALTQCSARLDQLEQSKQVEQGIIDNSIELFTQAAGQLREHLTSQLFTDTHHELSQFYKLMNNYISCLEEMPPQVMTYCKDLKEAAQQEEARRAEAETAARAAAEAQAAAEAASAKKEKGGYFISQDDNGSYPSFWVPRSENPSRLLNPRYACLEFDDELAENKIGAGPIPVRRDSRLPAFTRDSKAW